MNTALSILRDYVLPVLAAIGVASASSAWLPKAPTPGTPYATFRKILDIVAQNYGSAKNKP